LSKKQKIAIQAFVVAISALVIFADQLAKALVIQNLRSGIPVSVVGELVQFNLVYNDSAAFSMGFGATSVLAVISTLAALAMLWYSGRVETKSWALLLGIALGGVVGNLVDRLTRAPGFGRGLVVDFIQIPFNFPIFNIADSAIVVVAIIVVLRVLRGERIGKARVND
jgi:signal peptidase II